MGWVRRSRTRPTSFRLSCVARLVAVQGVHVDPVVQVGDDRLRPLREVCLTMQPAAPGQHAVRSAIQHTIASMSWATAGLVVRAADHVAAGDVDVVVEQQRHRHGRERLVAPRRRLCSIRRDRVVKPDGRCITSSPGLNTPPATWPA